MKGHHFLGLAVLVLLGYFLGFKFPGFGARALAKVGL